MHFINKTCFEAGWAPGVAKDGREQLIVAIKATYQIPKSGEDVRIADTQQPLIDADISTGEPGYSAILYESDFASYKSSCDVLFNGCAYSPLGDEVTDVAVSLQVGDMYKAFRVVGHRTWGSKQPKSFRIMPISYDNAFGGVDTADQRKFRFYQLNPIGTGYSYHQNDIKNMPLPNTEELNDPVTSPKGTYKPMALGPIGRSWIPRVNYVGTYDQDWVENIMPFYPKDFDERYYQSAPPDQQTSYLKGGEQVVLKNLSPNLIESFILPKQSVPVIFTQYKGHDILMHSVVDTLIVEPELGIFTMVSRATLPLRKNIHDIKEVIVGDIEREWQHKQRSPNKKYYSTLADFIERKGR